MLQHNTASPQLTYSLNSFFVSPASSAIIQDTFARDGPAIGRAEPFVLLGSQRSILAPRNFFPLLEPSSTCAATLLLCCHVLLLRIQTRGCSPRRKRVWKRGGERESRVG